MEQMTDLSSWRYGFRLRDRNLEVLALWFLCVLMDSRVDRVEWYAAVAYFASAALQNAKESGRLFLSTMCFQICCDATAWLVFKHVSHFWLARAASLIVFALAVERSTKHFDVMSAILCALSFIVDVGIRETPPIDGSIISVCVSLHIVGYAIYEALTRLLVRMAEFRTGILAGVNVVMGELKPIDLCNQSDPLNILGYNRACSSTLRRSSWGWGGDCSRHRALTCSNGALGATSGIILPASGSHHPRKSARLRKGRQYHRPPGAVSPKKFVTPTMSTSEQLFGTNASASTAPSIPTRSMLTARQSQFASMNPPFSTSPSLPDNHTWLPNSRQDVTSLSMDVSRISPSRLWASNMTGVVFPSPPLLAPNMQYSNQEDATCRFELCFLALQPRSVALSWIIPPSLMQSLARVPLPPPSAEVAVMSLIRYPPPWPYPVLYSAETASASRRMWEQENLPIGEKKRTPPSPAPALAPSGIPCTAPAPGVCPPPASTLLNDFAVRDPDSNSAYTGTREGETLSRPLSTTKLPLSGDSNSRSTSTDGVDDPMPPVYVVEPSAVVIKINGTDRQDVFWALADGFCVVRGLEPNTAYSVTMSISGHQSVEASFYTLPPEDGVVYPDLTKAMKSQIPGMKMPFPGRIHTSVGKAGEHADDDDPRNGPVSGPTDGEPTIDSTGTSAGATSLPHAAASSLSRKEVKRGERLMALSEELIHMQEAKKAVQAEHRWLKKNVAKLEQQLRKELETLRRSVAKCAASGNRARQRLQSVEEHSRQLEGEVDQLRKELERAAREAEAVEARAEDASRLCEELQEQACKKEKDLARVRREAQKTTQDLANREARAAAAAEEARTRARETAEEVARIREELATVERLIAEGAAKLQQQPHSLHITAQLPSSVALPASALAGGSAECKSGAFGGRPNFGNLSSVSATSSSSRYNLCFSLGGPDAPATFDEPFPFSVDGGTLLLTSSQTMSAAGRSAVGRLGPAAGKRPVDQPNHPHHHSTASQHHKRTSTSSTTSSASSASTLYTGMLLQQQTPYHRHQPCGSGTWSTLGTPTGSGPAGLNSSLLWSASASDTFLPHHHSIGGETPQQRPAKCENEYRGQWLGVWNDQPPSPLPGINISPLRFPNESAEAEAGAEAVGPGLAAFPTSFSSVVAAAITATTITSRKATSSASTAASRTSRRRRRKKKGQAGFALASSAPPQRPCPASAAAASYTDVLGAASATTTAATMYSKAVGASSLQPQQHCRKYSAFPLSHFQDPASLSLPSPEGPEAQDAEFQHNHQLMVTLLQNQLMQESGYSQARDQFEREIKAVVDRNRLLRKTKEEEGRFKMRLEEILRELA